MSKHSELRVMHSSTGYYIGQNNAHGYPVSRESGYFPTYRGAEEALLNEFRVRNCSENNHAYEEGLLPDIRK